MANITKIYDIKLQGEKELVTKMNEVNKQFNAAKTKFKDLKAIISAGGLSSADMEKCKLELQQANIELVKSKKANQDATLESKAYTLAKRQQADAEKQSRVDSKLTLDAYQKMSKELNEQRKLLKAMDAENPTAKHTKEYSEQLSIVTALDKELKDIDARAGQFQRNVGNYPKDINIGGLSSGVINQLKNSGLGNVLGNQIDQTKGKVIQLNSEFVQMKSKLDQAKASGVTDLNELEKGLIQNRIEADKLGTEIQQSQTHLNGLGSVGSNIFSKMNIDLKTLVLGYVGIQAAMSAVTDVAHKNYEMSDSLADLQIRLKGSKEDTNYLVDALKKIPTRTSLAELIDTGSLVAKKGVAKEEIAGITESLDKYFVVAGKGAGNREEGTASIVKLISIFNDDKHVTKDRVEELTSGLVGLQNSGVATGSYMVNLAERIGSVRGITGITLPSVLGMGAALEQLGQKSEVAGTAGIQIVTKMFADVPKYAKMAGMSVKDFQKLLDNNPIEALVTLAEKLKAGKNFEAIAQDMEEVGVKGARVKAVLGDIAGNAEFMRKRMKDANDMMKNTGALSDANAIKQKNYAATIDGMKKSFELLATDPRVLNFLSSMSNSALAFIGFITAIPFGIFITGISLMGAAWLYYKGEAISAGLATQWNSEQTLLGTIRNYAYRLGIIETGTAQYMLAEATRAEMLATEGATVAQEGLNVAMELNPLGIILALIGLAIPLFSSFTSVTNLNTKSINENSKALSSAKEVQNEFNSSFAKSQADLKSKVEPLLALFKSEKSTLDIRKKAYQDLIKISPDFVGTLDDEFRATDKLTGVYDKLITKLKEVEIARAQEKVRQRRADNLASAQENEYVNAQKAQEEINKNKESESYNKRIGQKSGQKGLDYELNKKELLTKAQDEYSNSILRTKQAQKEFDDYVAYQVKNGLTGKTTASDSKASGTSPTYPDDKASKLTGPQKDYLRDINALREAELSELKKSKLEGSITEEQFLIKSLQVNIKYNDKILEHFKGTDATTRKLRADTASDSIDKKIETNAKLFKLQEDELNQTLSNEKAKAQAKLDEVNSDPYSSPLDKAQAEQQYFETLLNLQVDFNTKMNVLENTFKQESKKNAEERKNLILKEQSDLNKKQYELSKAQFESLITGTKDFEEYRKNLIAIEASKKRMSILNDKTLTQEQKQHELEKINSAETLASINAELGAVNSQIAHYEKLKETQRLTNEELQKYNELLKNKQLLEEKKGISEQELKIKGIVELELPSAQSLQKKIQKLFSDANGKFIIGNDSHGNGVDGSALLGQAIAQSFDLASQAMNNYFEGERQAVEQSKQLAYERIELEKKQLLAKAQSQNEKDSIEKKAVEKKKIAEKEAGERLKKIKKNEAKIAFATEMANIWSSVWSVGNPYVAIALGAVMTGLAVARYATNVKEINTAQYAKGGKLPTKGGPFVGNSHDDGGIPVGMNEFEGDELAIINKKSAKSNQVFTVTGTPNQIASKINAIGGGVDWAGGASLQKYMNGGTYLGSNVQPPVFRSYYENRGFSQNDNNSNDNVDVAGLHNSILELRDIVYSESRKKVVLNPNELKDYQREKNKQSEIATL